MGAVIVKKEGDVASIVFNRPSVLNAINKDLINSLYSAIKSIEKDKKIRFVILSGIGKAFCVGGDLKEFYKSTQADAKKRSMMAEKLTTAIESSNKVYVAKLHGYCLGGGLEIALACDIRIASKDTIFGHPEAKIGITPGYGGMVRLPSLIGVSLAKKLLLTGEGFSSEYALKIGLIHDVVRKFNLNRETNNFIKELRVNAPGAVADIKKALYEMAKTNEKRELNIGRKYFSKRFGTKEQKEGMKAFFEKRKSKW